MRKYSKDKKTVLIQYFCYMKFLVYKQAISERLIGRYQKFRIQKWTGLKFKPNQNIHSQTYKFRT